MNSPTAPSNPTPSNPTPSNPTPSNPTPSNPTPSDAAPISANQQALVTMLAEFSAGNPAGQLAYCHDDIEYEAPYYEGFGVKRGVEALAAMLTAVEERFDSVLYEVTEFIDARDPNIVVAEVRGDHPVKGSNRRYQNHYVMILNFRDGKVARWREFSNPDEYRRAVLGQS